MKVVCEEKETAMPEPIRNDYRVGQRFLIRRANRDNMIPRATGEIIAIYPHHVMVRVTAGDATYLQSYLPFDLQGVRMLQERKGAGKSV